MSNDLPEHRHLTFFGPIRQPATNSLRAALCTMVNEGAKKVTILFASNGGAADDGIALYTYLRALPLDLEMHAVGLVGSMAVPVFLAADVRRASANASFYFHEFTWTYTQPSELTQTSMKDHSIQLEAARVWAVQIVKAAMNLQKQEFEALNLFHEPLIIDPARATETGLVQEVCEPAIPAGSQPRVVV